MVALGLRLVYPRPSSCRILAQLKLHFGVGAHVGIFQHVLGAAVTAGCLHGLKLACLWRGARDVRWGDCCNGNCDAKSVALKGIRRPARFEDVR